ncbi:MAG TPA: hypothetical protein PKK45_04585 [Leptospiraceae bacterium]|nr:hypothetical protein [Leptospiraceae bacterium]
MKGLCIFLALWAFASCAFLQKNLKDPAVNLYRRGSCVSIDIPPITLTPARTAAERQLIGEDREIEKDGWLLASARSTTRAEESVVLQESRRIYREQAVLEFYEESLREYARAGVLGEDTDRAEVVIVPERIAPRTARFRSPEEMDLARRTADEINKSRSYIIQYYLKQEKEKPGSDVSLVEKSLRQSFLKNLRPGDWVMSNGNWIWQK